MKQISKITQQSQITIIDVFMAFLGYYRLINPLKKAFKHSRGYQSRFMSDEFRPLNDPPLNLRMTSIKDLIKDMMEWYKALNPILVMRLFSICNFPEWGYAHKWSEAFSQKDKKLWKLFVFRAWLIKYHILNDFEYNLLQQRGKDGMSHQGRIHTLNDLIYSSKSFTWVITIAFNWNSDPKRGISGWSSADNILQRDYREYLKEEFNL